MADLVSDIRDHLLTMAPHQRERRTAWELRVAADEIERLRLTDAEREALDLAVGMLAGSLVAAPLAAVLERHRATSTR